MLDHSVYAKLDQGIDEEIEKVLGGKDPEEFVNIVDDMSSRYKVGGILKGKVIRLISDDVVVDVGYKSEGRIDINEFATVPEVGEEVEVLLEALEDETGLIVLSKRKADRIRGWEHIIAHYKEGDVIEGHVSRKIRGGLLVDVGVPVFLPASQVDIRRIADIGTFLGQKIDCKIIKIDEARRNIVVSRRKLIEEARSSQKSELFSSIKVGDTRKGVVKNIADFGAFVDIGGVDGLLHITDMSWGRVNHPSEVVSLDEEIEVVILKVDLDMERVALGMKQKTGNPWEDIESRYPIGEKIMGKVINVTNYGAFIELEPGVEGLVHVSQMSWNKRIAHPSDLLQPGDEIEVVVLKIELEKEKQTISLGLKQAEGDPWDAIEERFPIGSTVKGTVRSLTNYGAFIEIEPGIDGLLHVKDISWTKRINEPAECLEKDMELEVQVLQIDRERRRIALGLKQMTEDPWENEIPEKYPLGSVVKAKITKVTSFGAFADLDGDIEGLLHVSEISDKPVNDPADVIHEGDEVEVTILKLDRQERRISLSMRG
jgi:small subunit ribosomal protein S1